MDKIVLTEKEIAEMGYEIEPALDTEDYDESQEANYGERGED